MNPAVEKFMEAMKDCGYTPEEIRDNLREAALDIIHEKYRKEYCSLKDALREMSLAELRDIVVENMEGEEL